MRGPLCLDQSELGQVPAQRIDQLGSLTHEQLPSAVQHEHGLLFLALDGHEPHGRPRYSLANGGSICRIVLASLNRPGIFGGSNS